MAVVKNLCSLDLLWLGLPPYSMHIVLNFEDISLPLSPYSPTLSNHISVGSSCPTHCTNVLQNAGVFPSKSTATKLQNNPIDGDANNGANPCRSRNVCTMEL
mmetsp:Transcript_8323/g.51880  ORF Transcript_8323/g.51880 Transcript_8323/m.51880 type:complete len:102 (-) Transcript_8323:706-1011(-)